jgi:hypothetical protein
VIYSNKTEILILLVKRTANRARQQYLPYFYASA